MTTRRPVEMRACVISSVRFVCVSVARAVRADKFVKRLVMWNVPLNDDAYFWDIPDRPVWQSGLMPLRCDPTTPQSAIGGYLKHLSII